MLQAVYTTAEKEFRSIAVLACADTLNLPYVTKDETTCYFIQFSIKAMVCKAEFYFTIPYRHKVSNNTYYKMRIVANRTGFYKMFMSTEKIIHVRYII